MALSTKIEEMGGGGEVENMNMASLYIVTAKYRCLRAQWLAVHLYCSAPSNDLTELKQ